jgi:hypothetical protein
VKEKSLRSVQVSGRPQILRAFCGRTQSSVPLVHVVVLVPLFVEVVQVGGGGVLSGAIPLTDALTATL